MTYFSRTFFFLLAITFSVHPFADAQLDSHRNVSSTLLAAMPHFWSLDDTAATAPQSSQSAFSNSNTSTGAQFAEDESQSNRSLDPSENLFPNTQEIQANRLVRRQIVQKEIAAEPVSLSSSSQTGPTGALQRVITIPGSPTATPGTTSQPSQGAPSIPTDPEPTPQQPIDPTILIRFNNVSAVEFIRLMSRISNTNFVFDEADLAFNITILSEEPTSVNNMMTALLQELRIHDLNIIEQGNNLVIHRNPRVNAISKVIDDPNGPSTAHNLKDAEIVTQVFRLNTTDTKSALAILKPLASASAVMEAIIESNQIVVTDLATNVTQMARLLKAVDAPRGGLVVGQYVAKNTALDSLIALADKILRPMVRDQTLVFVPHDGAGSIFIVASPFFVEHALAILEHLDQTQGETGVYDEKQRKVQAGQEGKEESGKEDFTHGGGVEIEFRGKPVPSEKELQKAEESQWTSVRGRQVYRPAIPEGQEAQQPPLGSWKKDKTGRWFFDTSPHHAASPGGGEGQQLTGASWVNDRGTWKYTGGETPNLPKEGTPPLGKWVRDRQGRWQFESAEKYEIPAAGTPPKGVWVKDSIGRWVFDQEDRYDMPKEGMPPSGRWVRDKSGNWQFEGVEGSSGSVGGIPNAVWVRDPDGNWSILPDVPGDYPKGIWHYNADDGSWQFFEGRKLSLPDTIPPFGVWTKDSFGKWSFVEGRQPGASQGGTPAVGFWSVDEAGNWRFISKDDPAHTSFPGGFWHQNSAGKWYFVITDKQKFTEGGLPIGASWIVDAEGYWGMVPQDGSEMPFGAWRKNSDGQWEFVEGHRLLLPSIGKTTEDLPDAMWVEESPGHWRQAHPGEENVHAVPKSQLPSGRWVEESPGHWRLLKPGDENVSLPPRGRWTHDPAGKWKFVYSDDPGATPGGVVSTEGFWTVDDQGQWRFIPKQRGKLSTPMGFWSRLPEGQWTFTEVNPEAMTPGGVPENATWIVDEAGNWGVLPGSIPGGVAPEGIWHFAQGKWRFAQGEKLNLSEGLPAIGKWAQDSQGVWKFIPGNGPDATIGGMPKGGVWVYDRDKKSWKYMPRGPSPTGASVPSGLWRKNTTGEWEFQRDYQRWVPSPNQPQTGPKGHWTRDVDNRWVFIIDEAEEIQSQRLTRPDRSITDLPLGSIERTQFYIYKVQFRHGDEIQNALMNIGQSLSLSGTINQDLVATINSAQWLKTSNSIVLTGTPDSLRKARELLIDIDRPLKQVFLEMLILETTVDDALEYGVTWATNAAGGNVASAQSFIAGTSPVMAGLQSAGINPQGAVQTPNAIGMVGLGGYTMGVIGQKITYGGTEFGSLSSVVRAQHGNAKSNVVMSPKILTEDNAKADIFVGINTRFKTQSISNDQGSVLTNNFEFRDVGTRLSITPIIGDNGLITLDIDQEVSRVAAGNTSTEDTSNDELGPTTRKSLTHTRVHVPDGYFLVLSGMIQDDSIRSRAQVPCLGGIPVFGALFSHKTTQDAKRNLMIFVRPKIIDSIEEIQNVTKHQQDVFREKNILKGGWRFEVDEFKDFLNVKNTDSLDFSDKQRGQQCVIEAEKAAIHEKVRPCVPCGDPDSAAWRNNPRLYR